MTAPSCKATGDGDRLAVDEGAVGGAEIGDQQAVAGEFQAAMAARHGAAFQDDIGGGGAADRRGQGGQGDPPGRRCCPGEAAENARVRGMRRGAPSGGWAEGDGLLFVKLLDGWHAHAPGLVGRHAV